MKELSVYPNPFTNTFTIAYILEKEVLRVTIEVVDLTGRIIKQVELRNVKQGNIQIDLGECIGIYILRVMGDGKQLHKEKLVCIER